MPFCLLCPHSPLGRSHKHEVVWLPSASSWACLGRALSKGLTLPLRFSLSPHMVGTRGSYPTFLGISLARWGRGPPVGNEGVITGEGGWCFAEWIPSHLRTRPEAPGLCFFLGAAECPSLISCLQGSHPCPASSCKRRQLAAIGSYCPPWALFLFAGSNAYSSKGCIFFN